MSMVAHYARLSAEQMEYCAKDPSGLADRSVSGVEVIDVDRTYEALAWLLSPCKRVEQSEGALLIDEMIRVPEKRSLIERIAGIFGKQRTIEPSSDTGTMATAVKPIEPDAVLIAIEGRSERRDARFDFGLGDAAVFDPDEVAALSSALQSLAPDSLEHHYNPAEMDRVHVFPAYWEEEGRELMEEDVIPGLSRLQAFYRAAACAKQYVLIWYV